MHPKQLQSVTELAGADRYAYFIAKVADFEVAFGLYDDGWAMMADNDGNQCFPIWPQHEFAEQLALEDWSNYSPKMITLSNLIKKMGSRNDT